jgi:TRAP-type mannitol/chloroaromatic compound transport system permease small subunit
MLWVKRISRALDAISEWTGRICAWALIPLFLTVLCEVLTRYVLQSPGVWAFETSIQLYAFHFMILSAYTLLKKGHVSVDIFVIRLSQKSRSILEMITSLIFFLPFILALLIEGIYYFQESWAIKEVSYTVFAPPLYPIKAVIPLTALFLLIQGVSDFLKNIVFVAKGEKL